MEDKDSTKLAPNDHRVIGKELDLFVFSDLVGKGLPMLTPKGTVIRRELEKLVLEQETKDGYEHVITPPLAKVDLYRTSGHYPYYKDTMYPPMVIDEEELILRPMTCPHHFMLYKSRPRSYRELPLKLAELSPQFRYENSGELTGLMRVRMFCLSDAHIFIKPNQAKEVVLSVIRLIDKINLTLGLRKGEDYSFRLSLGDRKDEKKYYKDDAAWDIAEDVLRGVLSASGDKFIEAGGEAAFYGPKIDVQMKNIHGKEETAFTIQYDFVMPKRFDLKYTDSDGTEKQPIVIHRSSIGAFERTMAFLIEKYNGAFPVWLSPVQVKVIPVTDKVLDYATAVNQRLQDVVLRTELDDRNDKLGAKIRDAQLQKVTYMLIIGQKEQESGKISLRLRDERDLGQMGIDEFIQAAKNKILTKSLELW